MKTRTWILLLLFVMAGSFLAAITAIRGLDEARYREVAGGKAEEWTRSVVEFFEGSRAPLVTMSRHYAALDGMVAAIAERDSAWIRERLTRQALNAYDANAVWIYDPNFAPVYALRNYEPSGQPRMPLTRNALVEAFAERRQTHFFVRVPGERGSAEKVKWMEVFGVSVHPAWDAEGTTEPQGYFFVGRLWDRARLEQMAQITGNDVRVYPSGSADVTSASEPGAMRYTEPLRGIGGDTVAVLSVSDEAEELREMARRSRRWFATLVALSLTAFGLLSLALLRSINRPLQRMMRSLKTGDLGMIRQLESSQSEFGELARLIVRFHEQRENLLREMKERIHTEQALRVSEERLQHSQKLEAMGRLAGGIAHDFNNLLTAIIGYADLLHQTVREEREREYAHLVVEAGERAAGLTRQLLAFSRKQVREVRVLDLNHLVISMEKMLRRIIGEHIELETLAEAPKARIRADHNQVEQIVLNLGVNARDAMPHGGRLTIRTASEEIAQTDGPGSLPGGLYVVLVVSDTGAGMDEETQSHIFEPFFTTKPPGKGTGLGLATVYGIVQQSGGDIVVRSKQGEGSTFKVYLPAADGPVEPVPARPPTPAAPVRLGRVMIAEDEEVVRDFIRVVLAREGYQVLCASSGEEALELTASDGSRIDLLITDVIMPQMNGAVLAEKLRARSPGLRVLFVSGYSARDLNERGVGDTDIEVLNKPFTPDTLREHVARLLEH